MTKENAAILIDAVSKNCSHIKKVKKKYIVFTNSYWAGKAYGYIWSKDELFDICGGMYMYGGGQILFFRW